MVALICVREPVSATAPVARTRWPSATGVVQVPQETRSPSEVSGSASTSTSSSCRKKAWSSLLPWKSPTTTPSTVTDSAHG